MAAARLAAFAFFASAFPLAPAAQAAGDDALTMPKGMSDDLASEKTISLSYDAHIEVIAPEMRKIQFTSSGQALLSRPDRLHATRAGGHADVVFNFDGKTAAVLGRNMNAFVQLDGPGTLEQLIDKLRNDYSVSLPGADLLVSKAFEVLSPNVLHAAHIGQGVVNGFEYERLAFRNQETDRSALRSKLSPDSRSCV